MPVITERLAEIRRDLDGPVGILPPSTIFQRRPDPDSIRVLRDADFEVGRAEFGFSGYPADAFLLVSAGGIAGGGPTTQTLQVAECTRYLADTLETPPPTYFVGQQGELPYFADALTGRPAEQIAEIRSKDTIPERFKETGRGITRALLQLSKTGARNIVVLTNGYTAYVPWGIKQALEHPRIKPLGIRVKCLVFDSSFPDTSNPTLTQERKTGLPTDRFYPDAYRSTEDCDVYMILCNFLPLNIKQFRRRAPLGTIGIATTLPFSFEYVEKWLRWSKMSKTEARSYLSKIDGLDPNFITLLQNSETIFLPLFASSGYWDHNNVYRWLTEAQYRDMLNGTRTIVHSADHVAKRLKKPILLTGCLPFVDWAEKYAQKDGINIFNLKNTSVSNKNIPPGVYLDITPTIKQSQYGALMKAAHVGLLRSTQLNTIGEAIPTGLPIIVISMPQHGYMDAEFYDVEYYGRGGRVYGPEDSPVKIGDRIYDIITDPGEALSLAQTQLGIFKDAYSDVGQNFVTVLSHLSGIPYNV